MKTPFDQQMLTNRFMLLSVISTVVLLATIIISVNSYGEAAWEETRKVGVVISGDKDAPGRNRAHYEGLKTACDRAGYDLIVRDNVGENSVAGKKAVHELIESGTGTIFLLDNVHAADIGDLIENYPQIKFFLVGLYSLENNKVIEYSIRDYEPRYLSGLLAGLRTKTGNVGYVAPYSASGINRGINAFVLGVRKTNPNARVLLTFTGSTNSRQKEEQAVQTLKAARADVLTYHQDSSTVAYAAERAGIYFISMHELYKDCTRSLGAVKMNWTQAYTDMLKSDTTLNNSLQTWPGMVENMIDLDVVKSRLSSREFAVFETERAQMKRAKSVFEGDLYDRLGAKRCNAGETISGKQIRSGMGWLIQGVTIIDN